MTTREEILLLVLLAGALIVALVFLIIWGLKYVITKPIEKMLKQKYTRGELSKEQFEDLRKYVWRDHGKVQ